MIRRLAAAASAIGMAVALSWQAVAPAAVASPVTQGAPAISPAPTVASITGVPTPCAQSHPWPDGASQASVVKQLSRNTGFNLTGAMWTQPQYLPMVKIVWQTLEGLGCTDYVRRVTILHPGFSLNAAAISGYAWGDWGLTKPGATTLDFHKWAQALAAGDPGRLVRILVHELGHAWDSDRDTAAYWRTYTALQKKQGAISAYGSRSVDENFSEIVGYYVARCAKDNPYNTGKFGAYYAFVKQTVFGGREFGPAAGRSVTCTATAAVASTLVRPNLLTPATR